MNSTITLSDTLPELVLCSSTAGLRALAEELICVVPGFRLYSHEAVAEVLPAYYLELQPAGLYLHCQGFKALNLWTFYNDFIQKRRTSLARELLLLAIKLRPSAEQPLRVLDCTAGLGRDGVLLAMAGFQVTLIESNPYLALILKYLQLTFATQLAGLSVFYGDSLDFMAHSLQDYAVVYLDPMFADGKSALAKKDMQLIDALVSRLPSTPSEPNQLFQAAQRCCSNKLVVKRDNKQAALVAAPLPTYCRSGKTIRFDVYQCSSGG